MSATERCHMRTNGKQCKTEATYQVYIKGGSTNPIPWKTYVCTRHGYMYTDGSYAIKELKESVK